MLVLSRKPDDKINIGEDIVISILGIEGEKVKIGIIAPKEIKILRGEIFDAVKSQEQIKVRLVEGPEPDTFKDLRELLSAEIKTEQNVSTFVVEDMPVLKE